MLVVPPLRFWIMYFGLGAIATVLELVRPSRKLNYWARDALWLDVASFFFYQFVVAYWAPLIVSYVPVHFTATKFVISIPFPLRLVAYYIVGDFGGYWMHRLTHTKYLWRVHHFHHSTTQMYWLAGVRCTIWQQALSNLPYIMWGPLLFGANRDVYTGLLFMNILTNHWMHMNFTWRSNWLEYVFVTPRSHAIHHSASPEHFNSNYGVVFSVWDRLFGTWVDPDTTKVDKLGAADIRNPLQAVWLGWGAFGTDPDDLLLSRARRLVPYLNPTRDRSPPGIVRARRRSRPRRARAARS